MGTEGSIVCLHIGIECDVPPLDHPVALSNVWWVYHQWSSLGWLSLPGSKN